MREKRKEKSMAGGSVKPTTMVFYSFFFVCNLAHQNWVINCAPARTNKQIQKERKEKKPASQAQNKEIKYVEMGRNEKTNPH